MPLLNVLEFSAILATVGWAAGFLGAITGLGGGIVIVPVLVIFFNIDLRIAMGTSLLTAIATSSGASFTLAREKYTNIRIGMLLEIGAVIGAVIGATVVQRLATDVVSFLYGCLLIVSLGFSLHKFRDRLLTAPAHNWALRLGLNGTYKTSQGIKEYRVYNVPLGMWLMTAAGFFSGLLGIGSGLFKVLIFDVAMGLPYKVSTSTSLFMIGITTATGAGVYYSAGYIEPEICFAVIPGVLIGALCGAKVLVKSKTKILKLVFNTILIILAIKLIYSGIIGLI
jgi:uncharacterized membrane protein YfcA